MSSNTICFSIMRYSLKRCKDSASRAEMQVIFAISRGEAYFHACIPTFSHKTLVVMIK
jgi:hypothetical protein